MATFTDKTTVTLTVFTGATHLQDIATDGTFIYWCFKNDLVKSQLDGTFISSVDIGVGHGGGIAYYNDRIYIAWTDEADDFGPSASNFVNSYNTSDLSISDVYRIGDSDGGIGSMAWKNGRFFVSELLHTALHNLRIFEYDSHFRLVDTHIIARNAPLKGVETFDWINDRWIFTTNFDGGFQHIYADADFKVTGNDPSPDFWGGLGMTNYIKNQVLHASSVDTGTNEWNGTYTPAVESLPMDQSVMLKYGMEDNADNLLIVDSTNIPIYGTSKNKTNTNSTAGKIGNALAFVKANLDSIATDPLLFNDDSFSICAWIKVGVENLKMQLFNQETAADPRLYFRVSATGTMETVLDDGVAAAFVHAGAAPVDDDGWHLVIVDVDIPNELLSLYVDNVADGTLALTSIGTLENTHPAFIGQRYIVGEEWDGVIDEVIIFDKALSSAERTQLWNSGDGKNLIPVTDRIEPFIVRGTTVIIDVGDELDRRKRSRI